MVVKPQSPIIKAGTKLQPNDRSTGKKKRSRVQAIIERIEKGGVRLMNGNLLSFEEAERRLYPATEPKEGK